MLSSFSYSIVAKLLSILGSYWLKPVTFLSRSTKEIFEDMEKFCWLHTGYKAPCSGGMIKQSQELKEWQNIHS